MREDDSRLTDGFLAGDGPALAAVEGWIRAAAWPYRSRLGHRFEDVIHDGLREVLQALRRSGFRGDSSFKTFVWRVANNTCLDQMRSRRRWQWADMEEVEQRLESPASGAGASRRLEVEDLLLRVLAETSEDCRRLWAMIADGLTYREMSQRVGIAEGALRVRVLRCRKRAVAIRTRLLGSPA